MRPSPHQFLVSMLVCLVPVAVPTLAADATTRPASDGGSQSVTEVFELRNADPAKIAEIIQKTGGEAVCVPVEANKSLIVTTTAARAKQIESLIYRLDDKASSVSVRVIPLANARSEELAKTLSVVMPNIKVAFDRPTNSLLVDAASAKPVEELVAKLDMPRIATDPKNYSLRVVWLLSEPSLPAPPPDMKDVLQELKNMGIEDMQVAAQLMTVAHGKFSIDATSTTFTDCHLRIEGTLLESPQEPPSLDVTLSVTGRLKDEDNASSSPPAPRPGVPSRPGPSGWLPELASIRTTLSVPPGKKIVLGVAPIGHYMSAFIIQLVESPGATAVIPPNAARPNVMLPMPPPARH